MLIEFSEKYKIIFERIPKFIAELDVIKSGAKTSLLYNYCKPTITENNKQSFIECYEMRHPIIEQIQKKYEYIPNNCFIGKQNNQKNQKDHNYHTNGILLYGINASGKSSYMKAVGLNLILAQAGFYVAAKSFTYYPYTKLFTRISGNDNIFKQS